ncbi:MULTISPECIES: UDP-glucuronic acid decarboxylase family protein [unclassified Streptomyces]|uniref:UDP-glucuronic acid decarboxylase family protein n=1 Tax=unclassified Streptomyces TaxID=2593676 RepID=UPI000AAB46D3|nr:MULTISPECIES: UDP-glucuronic acid decarboxylase family protein [unclassified Streptomyces]
MTRKRVVVLGGAGFLGSHLCERFLAEGWSVTCVDNFLTGSRANLEGVDDSGFDLVEADVSQPLTVGGPVDAVLHFASPASPADYAAHPVETLRASSLGTFHALELARTTGARFLLASTSEVYGDPDRHPQTESYWGNVNPVGPRSCYDEAKRFAEATVWVHRERLAVNAGIVRIFNTYGPRMRRQDGRAVPNFIDQAVTGRPLTVAGDGSQTRSFCYVDDLVDGVVRAVRSDLFGPVNLGNPSEKTVLGLAELIRSLTGSDSVIRHVPLPQDDPRVRCPDISRATRELGWRPTIGLRRGLLRTIAWAEEHWDVPAGRDRSAQASTAALVGQDAPH